MPCFQFIPIDFCTDRTDFNTNFRGKIFFVVKLSDFLLTNFCYSASDAYLEIYLILSTKNWKEFKDLQKRWMKPNVFFFGHIPIFRMKWANKSNIYLLTLNFFYHSYFIPALWQRCHLSYTSTKMPRQYLNFSSMDMKYLVNVKTYLALWMWTLHFTYKVLVFFRSSFRDKSQSLIIDLSQSYISIQYAIGAIVGIKCIIFFFNHKLGMEWELYLSKYETKIRKERSPTS